MKSATRIYAYMVFIGAGTLLGALMPEHLPTRWLPLAVLVLLQVVTESYAFQLPLAGSVSLSYAFTYAALLYSGPVGAAVCALSTAVTLDELKARKPLHVLMFNAGQLVFSACAAGWVYVSLGGEVMAAGRWAHSSFAPAIAAALVLFLVNVMLVGQFVSLLKGCSFMRVLREQAFLSYGTSLGVLALIGFIIAYLTSIGSWFGLLLLVLPLAMARRTFRVYAELAEAYASTVRSLVTAIEAKDPYTRGHSERVAEYAQAIAGHMGLPQSDVQVLERAALLHDVGKIGISLDTLVSPDELSEDEMRAIRRHPGLGADLMTDVDFLHDIVDVVRCHHERCDGQGYPDGIRGEKIPLLARILAAADSFDAMTSDRAYRPGIPFDEAIDELLRVSGEQLDERVVASFVEVLRSDELGAMAS